MTSSLDGLLLRPSATRESEQARAMFAELMKGKFSYDFLSSHPDYLGYASAKTLAVLLPMAIAEMLSRSDISNYLVYPILTAVNPLGLDSGYEDLIQRTHDLASSVSGDTIKLINEFLAEIKQDPPVPEEVLAAIIDFWRDRKSVV